jgi:hypothetical protein
VCRDGERVPSFGERGSRFDESIPSTTESHSTSDESALATNDGRSACGGGCARTSKSVRTDWRQRLSMLAEALAACRERPLERRARRAQERRRRREERRMLKSLSERPCERLGRLEDVSKALGAFGRRLREDRERPRNVTGAPSPERETLSVDRETLSLKRERASEDRERISKP